MNKATSNFLSNVLKIIIGETYAFGIILLSLIPTLLGIEDGPHAIGFFLFFATIFSTLILLFIFKKDAKKEFLKEGKELIKGIWYLIIAVGILLGILIIIALFFITVSVMFSWLAGLGVTTLLALILIVIALK
jgi:peptidoglycan/LPS O-acetylase OafA/YrhL